MYSQVMVAPALSLVGGASMSLGALFVVLNPTPNLKMLGLLQGFAAGLMLCVSFLDLAPNAINSIGVILFAIVVNFIPKPTLAPTVDDESKKKNGDDMMKKHRRQVLFSGIITAVGISLHNFPEGMAVFLGSMKQAVFTCVGSSCWAGLGTGEWRLLCITFLRVLQSHFLFTLLLKAYTSLN